VEVKTRLGVGPVKPGQPSGSTRDRGHPGKPDCYIYIYISKTTLFLALAFYYQLTKPFALQREDTESQFTKLENLISIFKVHSHITCRGI
jgi:hypothetical protein